MKALKKREKNNVVFYYNVNKDILHTRGKLQEQAELFNKGKTRDIKFRIKQLQALKAAVKKNEKEILNALYNDLKKPDYESYMTEIGFVYKEIDHVKANLKKWAKPKSVKTPFFLGPARSWTVPEPYGQVLIIGPWNYPFQLIIAPLIASMAAGNVSILKPSELAPATSAVISKIIADTFDPAYVYVVEGGVEMTQFLLSEKFDHIFFTGGTEIGRIVMEAASKFLTPVTLELGGKSPVIVNDDASVDSAAKKIVWGKFINAGQTCIAPDYLLVHKDVKDRLLEKIEKYINVFYGEDPKLSPDYSRIINLKHYKRIKSLMSGANVMFGGQTSEKQLYISPTVIDGVPLNSPVMKEEIFGPVLPVIAFRDIDEAISVVRSMPRPLAVYLFTSSKKLQRRISEEISSGGLMINDNILHVANYYLPFGGVGDSGMGAYHGRSGFDSFSHIKPVMKGSRFIDVPLRYPPHKKGYKLLSKIMG
jgi:aldehyde dehydrogenase (NAD+)